MVDTKLLEEARKPHGDTKVILSLEQKGFCVSRLKKEKATAEKEGKDVKEFKDLIKSSTVSWVDYIVEDLKRDAPEVARGLDFSEQLVNSLLTRLSESGYEDLDNEMGILVPVIFAKGFYICSESICYESLTFGDFFKHFCGEGFRSLNWLSKCTCPNGIRGYTQNSADSK